MARIARRRVLHCLHRAAWPPSWPAAGRRRSPRRPTVHWLRWADFVPASDALLKGPITQECKKATRHHAQGRDRQRQRPAVAHHLGDPVGRRRRHHHGVRQLAAALRPRAWPTSSDVAEELGKAGGGYYDVSRADRARSAASGSACRSRPAAALIAYRKSWLEEAGYNDLPRDLGHLPRRRQEAEGQGAADRPDRGPHVRRRAGLVVSLPVVVRRQGGRGRRQDRRAEQQGNGRVDQVRRRPVEGDHGRRRARLGRHQQQPRLPVPDHQRHQQRRLDLHRSQEQARHLQDREGHADVRRTSGTPRIPKGAGRPVQLCRASSPTC